MAVTHEEMVVRAGEAAEADQRPKPIALGSVPEGALDHAADFAQAYKERLTPKVNDYVNWLRDPNRRLAVAGAGANGAPAPGAAGLGAPISNFCPFYVAFDIALAGPFELFATSGVPGEPFPPQKVIGGGEVALFIATMFVNPVSSTFCGFQVAPVTQLGGRDWRVRLEQMSVSSVTPLGISGTATGTFAPTASVLTFVPFVFVAPSPGLDPNLVEANATADITNPKQPFAAFATNVFDPDNDPAFAGIPSAPAGWQHKLPLRYLIFEE